MIGTAKGCQKWWKQKGDRLFTAWCQTFTQGVNGSIRSPLVSAIFSAWRSGCQHEMIRDRENIKQNARRFILVSTIYMLHIVYHSQCAICFLLDEPHIPTLLGSLPFKNVKRRIMEFWSKESFPLTFFEASQLVEMFSHSCGPSKVGKSMYSLLLAVTGGAWCYGSYLPWPRVRFGGRLLQIWVCYSFVYFGWWVNEKNMQSLSRFMVGCMMFLFKGGIFDTPWRYSVKSLAGFGWPCCQAIMAIHMNAAKSISLMHWLHEIRLAIYISSYTYTCIYIYMYVYIHIDTPRFLTKQSQGPF